MFKEGLDQKGQPPSPTKSKAEQPEDLQGDAEGRWSDSFSELLISFAFWGERLALNSWERNGKLSFKHVDKKVPFGLDHEILILLKRVSSLGRFRITNAIFMWWATDHC